MHEVRTTILFELKLFTFLCQDCKQYDVAGFSIVCNLVNTHKQGIRRNSDPASSLAKHQKQ